MTKRRQLLLGMLSGMLLLTLGLAAYGYYQWQQFKHAQGIVALDLDGLRLSWKGLQLDRIKLSRQSSASERLDLAVEGVRLDLNAWWRPLPANALYIEHVQLQWQPTPEPHADGALDEPLVLPAREQLERWAAWIPRNGHIVLIDLALPCLKGTCTEQAELHWQHGGAQALPLEASLHLLRNEHRLTLEANAAEEKTRVHLALQMLLDEQLRLSSQHRLTPAPQSTGWEGTLAMSELPEAPWLLDWLAEWLPYEPPALAELPQQMRIGAGWNMLLDEQNPLDWRALRGELRLSADLPAPWPIVGLGQLQGRLDMTATGNDGLWIPTEMAADLQLQPAPPLVADLPESLRPTALHLQVTPGAASESSGELPLQLQLATQGNSAATLAAQLVLDTAAPYSIRFSETLLKLESPALRFSDMLLKGLDADLRLSGEASQQAARVRLEAGSRFTLAGLTKGTDLAASRLQLDLAGLAVEADLADQRLQRLQASGPMTIKLAQLRQPALRPQGWRWNGQLDTDLQRLSLQGPLTNDSGLALSLKLVHDWPHAATRLHANLPAIFLRAGNPLASTLADWPPLLELSTGRLQAQGRLDLPASGPLAASATLDANGLGGIFDRTELSGLDTSLALTLQGERLRLKAPELTLKQANPGIAFGPLSFRGEYVGNLARLGQGRLDWQNAEARVLGGRLWLDPGAADLAAREQRLRAHLRGLQLPLLLEAYPTEGLAGTGVIDGELQLQRSEAGLSIEKGSLRAREPGGVLRFRSAKMQALGQSNPAMHLVVEALDDFHYHLLTSDVHYSTEGKLDLGLKLSGRNPALEGGRPVNLTINLQEDIPALLTSLQLSDRVSETIRRRVQERLE
ncbi:MAG: YdbH domain-containing protein [Pseudomonas sp.]